jgi:crossover junction endodeoxyribonuclease RuvC
LIVGGIDPGIASGAFAVVYVVGQHKHVELTVDLKTSVKLDTGERWQKIWSAWDEMLVGIEALGIEEQTRTWIGKSERGQTNAAALLCQEAVGLARGWALSRKIPVYMITPQDVKKAVLGTGSGTKDQVQLAIARLCSGSALSFPTSSHENDAVAVALATAARLHYDRVIQKAGGTCPIHPRRKASRTSKTRTSKRR